MTPSDRNVHAEVSKLRAFVALDFDSEVKEAMGACIASLSQRLEFVRVRWVASSNLHLTLRFLGDIDAVSIPFLIECVAAEVSEVEAFRGRLVSPALFPSKRRPRVIAVGLEPSASFRCLAAAVEHGVVTAGFPKEPRPFRAHVTLGRLPQGRVELPELEALEVGDGLDAVEVRAREVVLFRSDLRSTGPVYTQIARIQLRNGPRGVK